MGNSFHAQFVSVHELCVLCVPRWYSVFRVVCPFVWVAACALGCTVRGWCVCLCVCVCLVPVRARGWVTVFIGKPFVPTAIPTHPIDGFDGRA